MPQSSTELLDIEVAYATAEREIIIALRIPRGSTAHDAINRSGILAQAPEIDLEKNKIGVYGKLCPFDYVLYPFDRVEIYRSLLIDPKDIRRLRASKSKTK